MFLSIFKEKTLDERLERFFTRLQSGKLKARENEKSIWLLDGIEMKMEESVHEIRYYFNVDYHAIYVFHYIKEIGESKMVVEREEYLHENSYEQSEPLKRKIISFIERKTEKNPC